MSEVYRPTGLLAVWPTAMGQGYPAMAPAAASYVECGQRALVRINGPLAYEGGQGLDTYLAVRARVGAALASSAREVVIHGSSPGGDVNGLFDAARGIRDDAAKAGKRLIWFTDAVTASSAYALACACDEIHCSDTATLGSVGVIAVLPDASAASAAQGVVINIITSGERKADGNPMAPMTDAARAAIQQSVDAMAGVFFQHVADRRALSVDAIQALQAGVFVGQAAVANGLADSITSLDALLARPIGIPAEAHTTLAEATTMADKDEKEDKKEVDARAALVAASENPDEKDEAKRARAKRALAAYDAEMDEEKDEDKDAKAVSASADAAAVSSLAATVQAQGAELAALRAKAEADARTAFMATRPDLNPELVKTLAALPLDRVKAICAGIPVAPANTLAATAVVSATVGSLHGDYSKPTALSPQASALDLQMGLTPMSSGGVTHLGTTMQLGVRAPKAS